jgi:hypothetical protein
MMKIFGMSLGTVIILGGIGYLLYKRSKAIPPGARVGMTPLERERALTYGIQMSPSEASEYMSVEYPDPRDFEGKMY